MKKYIIILLTGLVITGCAGTVTDRTTTATGSACYAIGEMLKKLAPLRAQGKLNPATVRRVNSIKTRAAGICVKDSVVPAVAVTLENLFNQLKSVIDGVEMI